MLYSYTQYVTQGPNGVSLRFQNDEENSAVQLATVDGVSYVHVPDGAEMPDQPSEINWQQAEPDEALMQQIRAASPNNRLINAMVVAKIRAKYTIDEEIKLLRTQPSSEFDAWNDYVEDCRAWGKAEKVKIGLA